MMAALAAASAAQDARELADFNAAGAEALSAMHGLRGMYLARLEMTGQLNKGELEGFIHGVCASVAAASGFELQPLPVALR